MISCVFWSELGSWQRHSQNAPQRTHLESMIKKKKNNVQREIEVGEENCSTDMLKGILGEGSI